MVYLALSLSLSLSLLSLSLSLWCVCVCVCVCARECVGSDEKDVEVCVVAVVYLLIYD